MWSMIVNDSLIHETVPCLCSARQEVLRFVKNSRLEIAEKLCEAKSAAGRKLSGNKVSVMLYTCGVTQPWGSPAPASETTTQLIDSCTPVITAILHVISFLGGITYNRVTIYIHCYC